MMKFCKKMDKKIFPLVFAAFLWILLCNVIVQIFVEPFETIGLYGWTIFLANVLFFIKNNPDHKEGLLENFLGGCFGLLGALGFMHMHGWLSGLGVPDLLVRVIPITIFLFLTIALNPVLPYVFNNNALCFFLVSLINTGTQTALYTQPFGHFLGVLIGNVIVNVGTVLIVEFVGTKLHGKKE